MNSKFGELKDSFVKQCQNMSFVIFCIFLIEHLTDKIFSQWVLQLYMAKSQQTFLKPTIIIIISQLTLFHPDV